MSPPRLPAPAGQAPHQSPGQPADSDKTPMSAARQHAVALSYREGDQAPRVVAKGYGVLADTIIRTARENNLYVHESPELVSLLMQVDLDSHIPPQLYQAVAELLAWLYRLDALDPNAAAALAAQQAQSAAPSTLTTPQPNKAGG